MKVPLFRRLLPVAVASVLVILVLSALQTYRKSADIVARQHNLQHLRLIKTVATSLENRVVNMQAAFNHYAKLIAPPFGSNSSATRVCDEIERSFSTIVSCALIIEDRQKQDLWMEKQSRLSLTSDSTSRLERATSKSSPQLLTLHSTSGESLLAFLMPVLDAHLGVVVPFERLLATYHLNDTGYDEDYVWILDRDGTLLYHRHHPEMIGNNIYSGDARCPACHGSFELEREMARAGIGYGSNDVPKGSAKIVAYAPLNLADLHWSIAISEPMDSTTSLLQQSTRAYTLMAVLLSLVTFGTSLYITRTNHLRHRAEQEALHVEEQRSLLQQLDREHRQFLEAERFATVGRMAAQVAHEIKNPLSSISLNTELLGDELEADGSHPSTESRQLIQSILSEIDLLTKTIDEYLQFARFPKLQREEISLAEVLAGLQQLLHEESTSRAITLKFSVHPEVPRFCADSRLLRRALLNLIRNSFEAIGSNGWVAIEAVSENGDIRIEVADSGPGIAAEHLPMLFEPFYTTKPKGTGLGLPLTRHIIFEHGGSINYLSTRGASRFVITLPIKDPGAPKERA